MQYTVELTRGEDRKVQEGWTAITHWQVTYIEENCKAVRDGEAIPGIEIELRSGKSMAGIVHLPTDGDSLWFMDPATGKTARSIQLEKVSNKQKVFRTGDRHNESEQFDLELEVSNG